MPRMHYQTGLKTNMLHQFPSWHRTDSLWILTPPSHTDCAPPGEMPWTQITKASEREQPGWGDDSTHWQTPKRVSHSWGGLAGKTSQRQVLCHRKHKRLGNALDGGKHVWDTKV